mmetsp:Transcript_11227/g.27080  ORF Transcript_11227/g.27080 Transcript_11227/m.27080 type:complete len:335 (+) Transcript_11227:2788-3792(+)
MTSSSSQRRSCRHERLLCGIQLMPRRICDAVVVDDVPPASIAAAGAVAWHHCQIQSFAGNAPELLGNHVFLPCDVEHHITALTLNKKVLTHPAAEGTRRHMHRHRRSSVDHAQRPSIISPAGIVIAVHNERDYRLRCPCFISPSIARLEGNHRPPQAPQERMPSPAGNGRIVLHEPALQLPVRDAEREIRQIHRDESALDRDEVDGRTERVQMSRHEVADIRKIQHLHRRGTEVGEFEAHRPAEDPRDEVSKAISPDAAVESCQVLIEAGKVQELHFESVNIEAHDLAQGASIPRGVRHQEAISVLKESAGEHVKIRRSFSQVHTSTECQVIRS